MSMRMARSGETKFDCHVSLSANVYPASLRLPQPEQALNTERGLHSTILRSSESR
jgi:hypothetical protein